VSDQPQVMALGGHGQVVFDALMEWPPVPIDRVWSQKELKAWAERANLEDPSSQCSIAKSLRARRPSSEAVDR